MSPQHPYAGRFAFGFVCAVALVLGGCGRDEPATADRSTSAESADEEPEEPTTRRTPISALPTDEPLMGSDLAPSPDNPGRTVDELQAQLEALQKDRHEDLETVIDLLDIEPGMTVADIGCGTGFFTFAIADAVGPDGTVLAIDHDPYLLAEMTTEIHKRDKPLYHAIQIRLSERKNAGLEPQTLDLAFMGHIDFYAFKSLGADHIELTEGIVRALKPDGRLANLQWMGLDPPQSSAENVTTNLTYRGLTQIAHHHFDKYNSDLQIFEIKR